MTATLRAVADRAQVSLATASRVATGSASVSPATRQRVEQAMRELVYTPPRATAPVQAIGLLVPDLNNPIFPSLAQAIGERAHKDGYATILCTTDAKPAREIDHFRALQERGVDGMILVCSDVTDPDLYRRFLQDMHLVFVNSDSEGIDAPAVGIDERASGRLAAEHLLALGHTRIGLITGNSNSMASQRKIEGAETALRQRGLTPQDWIAYETFNVAGGRRGFAALSESTPALTGLICANDLIAIGAITEAAAQGWRVPDQLSVVGFDGTPVSTYCNPTLTTIEQPVDDLAENALGALLALAADPRSTVPNYVFRPQLRQGGSTGPAPHAQDTPPAPSLSELAQDT